MNKRGEVSISLKFLMGLLFTVMLILFLFGFIGNFSKLFTLDRESDLIDNWAEDITIFNKNAGPVYLTQLLPLDQVGENYIIFVFQKGSKSTLGYSEKTKQNLYKPTKCDKVSCICSFYTKNNKFEYCRVIDASKFSIFGTPYHSEDYYLFANKNLKVNEKPGNQNILYPENVYLTREGETILQFCLNAVGQKCEREIVPVIEEDDEVFNTI